ncbi:DUF7322 domain-containing protein [Haloterrigena alkaliphila]|uniref:DUF7322 domain-containing protein n=1 Tax=Haloterrigena alkaliphila TaxID=2816475 RepID=A0A8A2VDQ7_9EURY|nr:hypothetical protein [Haloterrigena alkaliphila]QSW98564.1 hypothetical protein J0X25_14355 [Haloterrigena alkaliphila]
MGSDRNEHEPEEYDPEEEFRDPESDSLTIPSVSTEDAGDGLRSEIRADIEEDRASEPLIPTDETDVPPELLETFWALVLVINGALLTLSLGVLFLVFEGVSRVSGVLLVVGLVLTGFAVRRYRNYQRRDDASPDADSTPEPSTAPPADQDEEVDGDEETS